MVAPSHEQRWFHVTASRNRESIRLHGLDWRRMKDARGIAGSREPEQAGCFLCRDEFEVDFFVRMNNTGSTADVWAVDGIAADELMQSPEGFAYFPGTIATAHLTLVRSDIPARKRR